MASDLRLDPKSERLIFSKVGPSRVLLPLLSIQQANSIGNTLSYTETDLTIKIDSKHSASSFFPQDTCLIYEKYTGILLWTDTTIENYHLKMKLENYNLPIESIQSITDDDDDDDDKEKAEQVIPSFPLIIIFGIISTISKIMILRVKKNLNK